MSNARKLGNMTTHGLDGDFNVDPTDNTLVVDSTNNRVGIGSATPTTTLDITGTATATAFSGPLTGNVTGTTSSISNHDTDALSEGSTNLYFTNARADARAQLKIDALVDSAPGTLDTLNELAAALGDDASFSTTITNSIATKLPLAGGTLTGALDVQSTVTADGLTVQSNNNLDIHDADNHVSGRLRNVSGSNNALAIEADPNNSASDSFINFKIDTSEKMRITSSGNVGIGTTSPEDDVTKFGGNVKGLSVAAGQVAIAVRANSNAQYVGYLGQSGANTYLGGVGGGDMCFQTSTSGLNRMTIKSDGNVGIGTTSPLAMLDIKGNTTTYDGMAKIYLTDSNSNSNSRNWSIGNGGSAFGNLTFAVSAAKDGVAGNGTSINAMVIDNTGNVGIGTSSPSRHLSLYGILPAIAFQTSTSGTAGGDGFQIQANSTDVFLWNYENTPVRFATNNTERMRIDSVGRVGIGTASPVKKLSIEDTGDVGISLRTTAANTNAEMWEITAGANSSSNADLTFRSRNDDGTGGSESLRLQYGGNVGIGNTSPDQKLTIGADDSSSNVGYIRLRGHNTLESNIYKTANYGIHMDTDSNSQGIRIDGGKLVLGMTGNVGIGIETPAQLLHVQAGATGNGTIRVGGGAGLEISHDNSSATIQRIDSLYRTTSANANLQLRTGILTAHIGTASTEAMRLDGANGLQVMTDSSNGTNADNVSIRYNGTAGGHQSGYLFKDKRNVVNAAIKNDLQDDGVGTAAAHLRFQTSHGGTLTTQMTIDRYGQVMMPNQPSFRAYSTTDYTADGVLESANWTEQHDNNGDFSNGRFTAPVDGVYLFEVMWDSLNSQAGLSLLKNTSFYIVRWEPTGISTNSWESRHYSTTVKLSSGDYVRLVGVHASGSNPFHMGGGHWGFFSGHLLG